MPIYYLIAIVHLALKYVYDYYSLEKIVVASVGQRAQNINRNKILEVEYSILEFIDYDFHYLTAYDFLDNYLSFAQLSEKSTHLAKYICF